MIIKSKVAIAVGMAVVFGSPSLVLAAQSPVEPNIKAAATEQNANNNDEKVERISVTSSRLKRIDIEPTRPVSVIGSDYISQRGITNAQQAVLDIPGVSAGASPEIGGNTSANSQGVGQRSINLFGLGSQRTLTLVNGSRFVSSNSPIGGTAAGSQLDVNNIPLGLIDRIEVVKVGGAAVYGADAVAGVVNYILKKDYQGAELSVDNRYIGGNLGDDTSVRGLVGGNFDGDRGNTAFAVEFNQMDNILAKDVESLRNGYTAQTPTAADRVLNADGKFFVGQRRLYPDARAGILSFSGLVTPGPTAVTNVGIGAWAGNKFYHFDPAGTGKLVPYNPGVATGNAVWSSGGDGLNLGLTNTAQEGYKRWNFTNLTHYKVNDFVNLTSTFISSSAQAKNPGYQVGKYSSGSFSGTGAALKFDTSHPFLAPESKQMLEGLLGGPGSFYMHKAWLELGQRETENETNVNSMKFAFDGHYQVLEQEFDWNLSYQKGWSSIFGQSSGVNDWRFLAALDVGINPLTNQIDCKMNYVPGYGDELRARGSGVASTELPIGSRGDCRALNPFGKVDPAALRYLTFNDQGKTRIEQEIFDGAVTADLFELPSGAVSGAAGFEIRREYARFDADASQSLSGFTASTLNGGYTTKDWFVELGAPLVAKDADILLLNSLSIEASYRSMDNNRAGRDDAWSVGVNYRPHEDVMIRANKQTTVRAPAITELFQPVLDVSLFATDPCDASNLSAGPNPAVRAANCAKEGIPTNFKSIAGNASRRGKSGGNTNLTNETATSSNIGIIYNPSWLPGFSVGADYVEINLKNAITEFTLTNLMEACYDSPVNPNKFCSGFVRGADFQLPAQDAFTTGYVNAAVRTFRAMEYNASYNTVVNDIPGVNALFGQVDAGTLNIGLRFYNQKMNLTSNTGFDRTDLTGRFDSPDWKSDLRITHSLGDLTTLLDVTYLGEGVRDVYLRDPLQYIGLDGQPYTKVAARTEVNLSINYQLTKNMVVRTRIENLTDWSPDPVERNVGRWTWGRSYNLGLTVQF